MRGGKGFRMYCNANRKSVQVVGNHCYMSTEWKRRAEEALVDDWEKLPREERETWATSGNKTAREKKAAEVEANVHKQFGRYMEKHNLLAGVKGVRERNFQAAAIINEVLADPQKKAEVYPELKGLAAERAAAIRQGHIPVELPRSAPKPAARQVGVLAGSGRTVHRLARAASVRLVSCLLSSDTEQSGLSSGIEAEEESELSGSSGSEAEEESELSGGSGSEAASDRRRQLPSRGVRSQQLWQQVTQLPYTPAAAVQQRAAVLWKVDGSPEWCDATVLEFDCSNGQHLLVYDDDDEEEWHDLREEAVRWPASGVETAPGASWPVQRAAAGASAGMEQQAAAAQEDFDTWYHDVSYSAEGAEELYAEGPEVEQAATSAAAAAPELEVAQLQARLAAEQEARLAAEQEALAAERAARTAAEDAACAAAGQHKEEVAQLQARLAAEQEALAAERAARTAAEDAACAAAGQHREEVAQLQARLAAEQEARTAAEATAVQCKAQLATGQTQLATGQEALAASAAEAERLEGLPEQKEAQQAAAEAEAPVTGSGSKRKRKPGAGGASGSGSAARAKRMKQQPGEMIPPRPAWQGRQGSGSAVAATGVRRSDRDGKGKMSEDYFKTHGRYGAP